jgi:hypothetical protein
MRKQNNNPISNDLNKYKQKLKQQNRMVILGIFIVFVILLGLFTTPKNCFEEVNYNPNISESCFVPITKTEKVC